MAFRLFYIALYFYFLPFMIFILNYIFVLRFRNSTSVQLKTQEGLQGWDDNPTTYTASHAHLTCP